MTKTITKIFKIDDNTLDYAKNLILNEDLVAFPTETVYGLGALATSDVAVIKTFQVKGRPQDNPLIVHVHKDYDLSLLCEIEHDYVYSLIKAFMPGPLTLVLKSKGSVSSFVTCGLDTIAVRMPSHKGCQQFLKYLDLPISAPSANISKHTSPVTAEHVYNDFNGKIDLILDGGKCEGGIESTVLDVTKEIPVILRRGLITANMIKKVVGCCQDANDYVDGKVRSPGMKYTHYVPKCQTALFSRNNLKKAQELYDEYLKNGKIPCFLCDNALENSLIGKKLLLGNNAKEVASNLYYMLHLAESVCDILIAIEVNTGDDIDLSVMNRLSKACKKID